MRATVTGDTALIRAFSRFGEGVKDIRPALELIADDMRLMGKDLFNSQGGSGGSKWHPLAPSTLRRKPPGLPILVRSGALRESLTSTGGDNITKISRNKLTFGTRDPKAGFHQHGTSRMPARPVLMITERDKKRWVKIMQRHLVGLARDAGFLSYRGGS